MIIEVLPKDNCAECVFCEEMIYCSLLNGELIEFEDDFSKAKEHFCPLRNRTKKVTDSITIIQE